MKKYFLLLSVIAIPFLGFSQSRFFVNVNAGWDYTTNKYYNYNNYSFFEQDGAEFSYGADLGYKFSDKVRFRVESRFGKYKYGNYGSDTDRSIKTTVSMNYFDITPRFDFRIWSKSKLELFVSPGLKLEYNSDMDYETTRTDGVASDLNYASSAYSESMPGFVGGVILKYNIDKHLGITFSPDYTLYFKKLYDKNDANMQRLTTHLGVEYNF